MDEEAAALARLREGGVVRPGWHLRRLLEASGPEQGRSLGALVERVCRGEPVHRVVGRREFHGLDLLLDASTLEPRDDTETLVSLVLDHAGPAPRFADLGTGPGTVGLALLSERPGARAVLTDSSAEALAVARRNAAALGFYAEFRKGSWCDALDDLFDFIVSNPPYIASGTIPTLDAAVREHDPHLALDGGADGLDAFRLILGGAAAHLEPGGFLALEIGFDQREAVERLGEEAGWRLEEARTDTGSRDRALLLRPRCER